jgi:LytS/YehU family sensor histidine kinase
MRIRIKKIATKAQEKQLVNRQLAELKLEAVRAQMNPHFIFNCLNAIQHYNVSHDFDSAQQFLSDFAMLIRKTLHLSKQDFISLREELSFLESYIKLEKMRFEDQFTYSFLIDPNIDLDQMKVPSLLLQPFVENSINHGLKYRKEPGGTIDISFTKSRDDLIVKVSDNGIGIARSMELKASRGVSHQSQGTNLTTNRIEVINKIYKTAMRLQISSSEAGAAHSGTNVTLIIPLTPSTL